MEEKKTIAREDKDRFMGLLSLCNKQNAPDPKAREQLREFMQKQPLFKELLQSQLSLYELTLKTRIEQTGASDARKEVMYVRCDQLKEELGYSSATSLEKLAIEQIVLCSLNQHLVEVSYEMHLSQAHSREQGLYWEKRLSFATNRCIKAMDLLSKMRKMNLVVQVNNSKKQVVNNAFLTTSSS